MLSPLLTVSLQLLFLCSSLSSLLTILYIAYVSNANADIGKEVLEKQNGSLLQIANYDSFTELCNRTYLRKTTPQLCPENCCLAIGDIDDFRRINDTYGRLRGDATLKQLAEHTRTRLDPAISVRRWGGEGFVPLFHDIREQDALQQLQDFCHWMNHTEFQYGEQNIPAIMTSGIHCHQRLFPDELINKADQLLYQGK